MGWLVVFAQARRNDPFRQPEVIWGTAGIALALMAGAFAIWLVDRWRKNAAADREDAISELTDYRGMYERGEITEDEYIRLRDRVARRAKAKKPPPAELPRPPELPEDESGMEEKGDSPL